MLKLYNGWESGKKSSIMGVYSPKHFRNCILEYFAIEFLIYGHSTSMRVQPWIHICKLQLNTVWHEGCRKFLVWDTLWQLWFAWEVLTEPFWINMNKNSLMNDIISIKLPMKVFSYFDELLKWRGKLVRAFSYFKSFLRYLDLSYFHLLMT